MEISSGYVAGRIQMSQLHLSLQPSLGNAVITDWPGFGVTRKSDTLVPKIRRSFEFYHFLVGLGHL